MKRMHQKVKVAGGPATWSCEVHSGYSMETGLGSGAAGRLGERSHTGLAGKEGSIRAWRGIVEGRGLQNRAVQDLNCWVNTRQKNSRRSKVRRERLKTELRVVEWHRDNAFVCLSCANVFWLRNQSPWAHLCKKRKKSPHFARVTPGPWEWGWQPLGRKRSPKGPQEQSSLSQLRKLVLSAFLPSQVTAELGQARLPFFPFWNRGLCSTYFRDRYCCRSDCFWNKADAALSNNCIPWSVSVHLGRV